MSEQLQDQIDRYLGGEMSPGEKEEFLVHAETNAQLREQLDETRSAQLALVAIDFEEKLDFVKGLESEEEGVVPIHKSRRMLRLSQLIPLDIFFHPHILRVVLLWIGVSLGEVVSWHRSSPSLLHLAH